MSQTAFPPNIRNFAEGHNVFLQYKDVDPIHKSKETVTMWEETSNTTIKGVEAMGPDPFCFPHKMLWYKGVKRAIPINVPSKISAQNRTLPPFMYIIEHPSGQQVTCPDAKARGWPTLLCSFDKLYFGRGFPLEFGSNGCWWHQVTGTIGCRVHGLVLEAGEAPTMNDYAAIVQVPWGHTTQDDDKNLDHHHDKTLDDDDKTLDDNDADDDDDDNQVAVHHGYYRGEPYSMALFDKYMANGSWDYSL